MGLFFLLAAAPLPASQQERSAAAQAEVLLEVHNTHWWGLFMASVREAVAEQRLAEYRAWWSEAHGAEGVTPEQRPSRSKRGRSAEPSQDAPAQQQRRQEDQTQGEDVA